MMERDAGKSRVGADRTADRYGNVSLQIDRLVVDGVPLSAVQSAQLRVSIERELTRLIERKGMSQKRRGGAEASVLAPSVTLAVPLHPVDLGRQIARSIHRTLDQPI